MVMRFGSLAKMKKNEIESPRIKYKQHTNIGHVASSDAICSPVLSDSE